MRRLFAISLCIAIAVFTTGPAMSNQNVIAEKVNQAPIIDGRADDPVWMEAPEITTFDTVAGIEIALRAVHTSDELFILVTFPDDTENRDHKLLVWDEQIGAYQIGPKREDVVILKWSMEPHSVDLSLSGDQPYRADVWYWKASRTDHAGYADDKMQDYCMIHKSRARRMISSGGRTFYLTRSGDEGEPAYRAAVYEKYLEDELPMYTFHTPQGSRADVRAKGHWQNGMWTVEFRRKLSTGHIDDVQFDPNLAYQFGISRFEIAGRATDPAIEQPNFGAGDVTENLYLQFR